MCGSKALGVGISPNTHEGARRGGSPVGRINEHSLRARLGVPPRRGAPRANDGASRASGGVGVESGFRAIHTTQGWKCPGAPTAREGATPPVCSIAKESPPSRRSAAAHRHHATTRRCVRRRVLSIGGSSFPSRPAIVAPRREERSRLPPYATDAQTLI